MNSINFLNKEEKLPTLLGDKHQIIFNKGKSNEERDFYFPQFKYNGSPEQLEMLRQCYNENVVNVVGPVQESSFEATALELAGFHPGWHGTGDNKRKYYKNELAAKKIYSQNGDLIIGATLMITVNIEGKQGTIMLHDPSKGPAGIGMASGNSEILSAPEDPIEKTIALFKNINNPMFKEIIGEFDNCPQTSNAPTNIIGVWRCHFINKHAIEMLNSLGITKKEFDKSFENEGSIIFKKHAITGHKDKAEYEEISHHMFIPEAKLGGVTHRIEKFQKDIRLHPLAMIQIILGIPRAADWSNLPLVLDANGNILHEKLIPMKDNTSGNWFKNLEKIKNILCSPNSLQTNT